VSIPVWKLIYEVFNGYNDVLYIIKGRRRGPAEFVRQSGKGSSKMRRSQCLDIVIPDGA
jgi:hypothetical protein